MHDADFPYKNMEWKRYLIETANDLSQKGELVASASIILTTRKAKVYQLSGEVSLCDKELRKGRES
jgi:hypothetical protein